MSKGFDKIKVGDLVAPIRYVGNSPEPRWTGALLKVTKVTPKRFSTGSMNWIDKATGRGVSRGSGSGHYELATPEMIAQAENKRYVADQIAQRTSEFHARPEYKYASAILSLLEEMTLDHHPLDRLTLEEWATLYNKLLLTVRV